MRCPASCLDVKRDNANFNEMRKYKTYTNAFSWRTILYGVGDIPLPFPLPIGFLVYFGVAEVIMFALHMCGLTLYNGIVHYIVVPVFLVKVLSDINPEDKDPLRWTADTILHYLKDPKEQWNFEQPERHPSGCFSSVSYRKPVIKRDGTDK